MQIIIIITYLKYFKRSNPQISTISLLQASNFIQNIILNLNKFNTSIKIIKLKQILFVYY